MSPLDELPGGCDDHASIWFRETQFAGLPDRDRKDHQAKVMPILKVLLSSVTFAAIASCAMRMAPIPKTPEPRSTQPILPNTAVPPTSTPQPTETPEPNYEEVGPESTADATVSYPATLSSRDFENILIANEHRIRDVFHFVLPGTPNPGTYFSELMTEAGDRLPRGFLQDSEVNLLIEARRSWLLNLGYQFSNQGNDDFVELEILTWGQGDDFRWDIVPKDRNGDILGWLQIRDQTVGSGWRFAERPAWDPLFDPAEDEFRFGLPTKLEPESQFELILLSNEHRILVELDESGSLRRWLNVSAQQVQVVEGTLESIWDPDRIRWAKLTGGTYNDVSAQLSIEIDFSIYGRPHNALIGFEEAGGTWADVGSTAAALVGMLPETANGMRLVEVNMDLNRDGTYTPVAFDRRRKRRNVTAEFDPAVPIRYIFFNGDSDFTGRVFPWNDGVDPTASRGWGVDPETQGLVFFMGMPSYPMSADHRANREWIYSGAIAGMAFWLSGASSGGLTPLDQGKFDILFNLYYGEEVAHPILGVFAQD